MRKTILLSLTWILLCLVAIPTASAYQNNFIARGDPAFSEVMSGPQGTCWFFPVSGAGTYYDLPSIIRDNETWCHLTPKQTWNLPPGTYTVLYEAPTQANGKYFKDVSWVNGSLVSAFSAVHSIDERGNDAQRVLKDLKKIIDSNGFNSYTENTLVIQEPDLKITRLDQTGDFTYTVSGTSNFQNGTQIIIKIDEERYFAQHDNSFTFNTRVVRESYDQSGTWSKAMMLPLNNMPPGWHNITAYAGDLVLTSRFKIDEREWTPAPTPTIYIKYLSNGDIAPEIITVVQTVVQVKVEERWHTATPTPAITDALGDKINYPYAPGETIPWWMGIGCLCLIAGIIVARDWKWKR